MQGDDVGLILEDDSARAGLIYQRLPDNVRSSIIWCQTVPEAIEVLENYKDRLRFVSLDHDLGGEKYQHVAREDCGSEVVRWLVKQNILDYKKCRFVVHSHNEHARPRMVRKLREAGYTVKGLPFGETDSYQ